MWMTEPPGAFPPLCLPLPCCPKPSLAYGGELAGLNLLLNFQPMHFTSPARQGIDQGPPNWSQFLWFLATSIFLGKKLHKTRHFLLEFHKFFCLQSPLPEHSIPCFFSVNSQWLWFKLQIMHRIVLSYTEKQDYSVCENCFCKRT